MIIDARTQSHPGYRPMTKIGAVAHVIHQIEVGEHVDIDGIVDALGNPASRRYIDTAVSKTSNGRKFTIKNLPGEGVTCRIYRLA